ncbi:MAG: hypothetical protein AAF600_19055 [Bacteroidota bacterium]
MNKQIKFTGGFGEYFIMSLGLLFLSIITFGIALTYWVLGHLNISLQEWQSRI